MFLSVLGYEAPDGFVAGGGIQASPIPIGPNAVSAHEERFAENYSFQIVFAGGTPTDREWAAMLAAPLAGGSTTVTEDGSIVPSLSVSLPLTTITTGVSTPVALRSSWATGG